MKYNLICLICDQPFIGASANRQCCSKTCMLELRRQRNHQAYLNRVTNSDNKLNVEKIKLERWPNNMHFENAKTTDGGIFKLNLTKEYSWGNSSISLF